MAETPSPQGYTKSVVSVALPQGLTLFMKLCKCGGIPNVHQSGIWWYFDCTCGETGAPDLGITGAAERWNDDPHVPAYPEENA